MWLTGPTHVQRYAWPTHKTTCTAETADVHSLAMTYNGSRVDDDRHGYQVGLLLLMLKHGQWLSAITTAAVMDHLHEMAPADDVTD